MARITEVPARERSIGERLRRAREKLIASQTGFALLAGIGRERLASYEYGNVPLPWTVGDKICEEFDISARWLVEGLGLIDSYFRPAELETVEFTARTLFSEVYDKYFHPYYQLSFSKASLKKFLYPAADRGAAECLEHDPNFRRLLRRIEAFAVTLPRKEMWAIHDDLMRILGRTFTKTLAFEQESRRLEKRYQNDRQG